MHWLGTSHKELSSKKRVVGSILLYHVWIVYRLLHIQDLLSLTQARWLKIQTYVCWDREDLKQVRAIDR